MNRFLSTSAVAAIASTALAQTPCTMQEIGPLIVGPPVDNFTANPVPLGFSFNFNGYNLFYFYRYFNGYYFFNFNGYYFFNNLGTAATSCYKQA